MPFGVKSRWDCEAEAQRKCTAPVTNAFRREVPLGRLRVRQPARVAFGVTNAFRREVPLGPPVASHHLLRLTPVTNAFRREVPLGHRGAAKPFVYHTIVTNAFRREVPLGHPGVKPFDFQDASTGAGREVFERLNSGR